MTFAVLYDIGLKYGRGPRDWLPNPFGVTTDEEFKRNRAANVHAVREYTRQNWRYLRCATRREICREFHGFILGEASLLAGTHFLGHHGMHEFVARGMREESVPRRAAEANGGHPLTSGQTLGIAGMRYRMQRGVGPPVR